MSHSNGARNSVDFATIYEVNCEKMPLNQAITGILIQSFS